MRKSQYTYTELLKDSRWQFKRKEIIERDKTKCKNCGSTLDLEVHHRQYHSRKENGEFVFPWEYKSNYLVTLCYNCHQLGHGKFKVPVFNV